MRILIFALINFVSFNTFSQNNPDWLSTTDRENNYPSEEYWGYLHEISFNKKSLQNKKDTEKEGVNLAKAELSSKITSSVNTQSKRSTVRQKDIYNSMFKMSTDVSSSVTFTDLKQEIHWDKKGKKCYIFLFVKKSDLQNYWRNSYESMSNTIFEKVRSCANVFYNIRNDQEALRMAEGIEKEIKTIEALQKLLSLFTQLDYTIYNEIIRDFPSLIADIKQRVKDDQNYTKNKENGEINLLSKNIGKLEISLKYFEKAKEIDPGRAMNDNIASNISIIEEKLYKLFCQEGLNSEELNQYEAAIEYYSNAVYIYNDKNIPGTEFTPVTKIRSCQDKLIDNYISQGEEEYEDNPNTSLTNFKKAKNLITSMNRNDRIKEINKLIKKAKKEIKKRKHREEKTSRKGRVKTIRGKSPHRLLFSIGGGFQNEYINHNNIFSNPINVDVAKWHISSTLGYRLNLPSEIITSNTGFEKTKGNVLGLFYKQGNTVTNFEDNNFQSTFKEIEFGYIFKERIRVSLGKGNRFIPIDYLDDELPSNYNCATGSWYMHFGRLSVETSVTYLLDEKLAFEQAKLNANFSLRFYLYKKIYKKTKEKIK